jgi:hypothetical protein
VTEIHHGGQKLPFAILSGCIVKEAFFLDIWQKIIL